jgi:putative transposase
MARLPRLVLPGIPTHAVVRGNDRQDIFRHDGDRAFLHRCLVEATRQNGLLVHAYVFMSNHVHLLVTPQEPKSLSRSIQAVGRRYVGYFNFVHSRTGTLWEGRYRSSPVETDRYLLACHRYIEMNPVRAGLVRFPSDYRWSSHRFLARGWNDELVTPHEVVLALAGGEEARRAAYAGLFEISLAADTVDAIRSATRKGWAVGGEEFCARVAARTGRPARPRRRGRVHESQLTQMESDPI